MASLRDIGPLTKTVTVKGQDFEVSGLSVDDVFDLILDYPDLEKLLQTKVKDFNAMAVVRAAPQAVGMMIATAIGKKNDQEEIDLANKCGFGNQIKFMASIFELTFSDGVAPFVDELNALTRLFRLKNPKNEGSDGASSGRVSAQFVMVGRSKKPGIRPRAN